MQEVTGKITTGQTEILLCGRIDSGNARQAEEEIEKIISEAPALPVVLNAGKLDYISSAGLRVVLHVRKRNPSLRIINAKSEVYEILEMTGFTEMMPVEKAYRVVSVEGCEVIGRGANGTVYRIDQDNVVKVYNDPDALEEIRHEREVAKQALILGIPTAISYDVVRVGDSYGSVFELLNARSFSKILEKEPDKMDWCVQEYTDMLKKIHGTLVPEGKLPDMKETVLGWARFMQDHLPEQAGRKLLSLVEAVPHDNHMIHGDYHTQNLELQDDEVLLIDMDTLAVGHPIFELGSMYNAYIGFSELDHEHVSRFQGFDFETARTFWKKSLAAYLETEDEEKIREVEDKARVIGYTRLIRRAIRRHGLEDEKGRSEIAFWKEELLELLDHVDSLLFERGEKATDDGDRQELELDAEVENMEQVQKYVESRLEPAGIPAKTLMQINLAVEEIFVNIARYAYAPDHGRVAVCADVSGDPAEVTITFRDHGIPYNPLAKKDPDVKLSAEKREVGGLGIFMTKKMMDDVQYVFRDGQNILILKKWLPAG